MAKFVDEFKKRIIRCRGNNKIKRLDSVLIKRKNKILKDLQLNNNEIKVNLFYKYF
jgi:hypothetical protein